MAHTIYRLKRTRAAQLFKRVVLRRPSYPLLSVVVPFRDVELRLADCVESLLHQHYPNVEIILVDDGSTDGSREIAASYVAAYPQPKLVTQVPAGVGAARNAGVRRARGKYLAFCDADDIVDRDGYRRLVSLLENSGSELGVGSVALQEQGLYQVPVWARRSNAVRRSGVQLAEVPELLANLIPGTRVFRRSFWDQAVGSFPSEDERSDTLVMVSTLLSARAIDIVPAVVYRWSWREDNRSLWQRDLRETARVSARLASLCDAAELVVTRADESLQRQFFAEVLHTTIPDLIRAAVCLEDDYWGAVHKGVRRLTDMMSEESLAFAPAEDRITAWLCAQDEREATEILLEYAIDNTTGFPFRIVDGRPSIALPFIDVLEGSSDELTRVADSELRYRFRLMRLAWTDDRTLHLEGAAFVEYLDDRCGPSVVTLTLTERAGGAKLVLPATPAPAVNVNQWANRANEDHTGAGFAVAIDVASIPLSFKPTAEASVVFDVSVALAIGDFSFEGPFGSHLVSGSPGLLEPSVHDGLVFRPSWRDHQGFRLEVRAPGQSAASAPEEPLVVAEDVQADADRIVLRGHADCDFEVALNGPRSRSAWAVPSRSGRSFEVGLSVLVDEWGQATTSLPADEYAVVARRTDDRTDTAVPVAVGRELWRRLPLWVNSDRWTFTPSAVNGGDLHVRVAPIEWRSSRPAFLRRRLRDEAYPAARNKELRDTVLFETFAGKSTGDNPGALCRELLRRGTDLDLAVSVIDGSTVVPEGARPVIRFSEEYFELLGRARYLLVNAALPYFFRKREGQLYFQTWHGSPLKRIAHDRPHLDFFNWNHRRQLLIARDGWDYLLSQSPFCSRALSSAFRYDGPILEAGYPRNDILLSPEREEIRHRVRENLGLGPHQKAVLYAPTWRDNLRVGRVFNKVLYLETDAFVEKVDDAVILLRGHYNSVGAAETGDPARGIVDVTRFPDIADLYLAADCLVTDYSSVFFDFVLTDKPMVFLAPDLVEYRDDNRGFYLDYHETVPGPICTSTDEVIAALAGPDLHSATRAAFREKFAPLDDGRASERVVDHIFRVHPPRG